MTELDSSVIPCNTTDLRRYFDEWLTRSGLDDNFSVMISDMDERFCTFMVKSTHASAELDWLIDINRVCDELSSIGLSYKVKYQDWVEVEHEGTLYRYDVDVGSRDVEIGMGTGFAIDNTSIHIDEFKNHIQEMF